MLVEYFTHRYARRTGKKIRSIDTSSLELLESYDWPGNVRELQNLIERAVIISDETALTVDLRWLSGALRCTAASVSPAEPAGTTLLEHERSVIEAALRAAKGRVAGPFGAAIQLGMPPSTLESKIKALSIDKRRFRPNAPARSREVLSRVFQEAS